MSFQGNGTFLINSTGNPVVTGTTISSTWANALAQDLATGLSTTITKDGQSTPTANIPMGANKITGLANGTEATDAATFGQLITFSAPITTSLGGNVSLSNTGTFFDGPSVAQGTSGTWFASGTVTVSDTAGAANIDLKLWDGTTIIASAQCIVLNANNSVAVSLSGLIASPAGNLRISAKDVSSTSGVILNNASGGGKDSTITAIRVA